MTKITVPAETRRLAGNASEALQYGLDNTDRMRDAVLKALGYLADILVLNAPLDGHEQAPQSGETQ